MPGEHGRERGVRCGLEHPAGPLALASAKRLWQHAQVRYLFRAGR